ncbi:zinc finger and BTB domain-containing protein 40-like [Armigeres subalbatus]|uniref:zinc finger and BTB domain-containing protein 40-like n=1 Tax=Armigeres subalbatus TaxID=124917 RepID=UPI002ED63413
MDSIYVQQQPLPHDEDPDVLAEDNTRPSLPEDFPNFRDFQIEKMVLYFRVVTDGTEQRLRLGFKCKLCGEVFNKTMQLLGHIRNHFEDNHICKDCGKYFFDTNKLLIHKRAKHTQPLKCQLGCLSYTTSNFKCLQTHYLRSHCIKIRSKDMKKMEESPTPPYRQSSNESKTKMQRETIADQQRSLSVVQTVQQSSPEVEDEDDDEAEDHDEDEFDEPEDYGQTVECCVCDVYIPTEEDLKVHEQTHSSPYTCKICFTVYDQLSDARNHYDAHEKTQVMQNPVQLQTVTLTPAVTIQHQAQPAPIPIATTSGQQQAAPNMTTMLIMHNGTPMLVPVQTFDSSQLVQAFPTHSMPAQISAQPAPGTTTITPITTAWPINHLLPVNNQIEIIPIHSAQSAAAAGPSQAVTLNQIPIQNAGNGGIVLTPVTTIDQHHYLRQQQALQAQFQQQQQLQLRQQQQQLQQQQYQPQL